MRSSSTLAMVVVVACTGSAEPTAEPSDRCPAAVASISARAAVLSVGDTMTFQASLGESDCLPSGSTPANWRWSTRDTLIARIDSLSGLAKGVRAGDVVIQVRHAQDRRVSSTSGLQVVRGTRAPVPVSGPSFADIMRNGDAWAPETRFYFRNGGYAYGDYLSIGFDRYLAGTILREGIGFYVPGFTGEGSYVLRSLTDSTAAASYGIGDAHSAHSTETIDAEPGVLQITGFDPIDGTVAGTFHFVLHLDPSEPARTTWFEGSFRVRPSEQLPSAGARP
ncbi:MAG TPA: hypothetical protein VFS33_06675 [Gemmatimonadales bacterium]|nr:hypothetical protein [Gemmatimonadales bacterium]